MPVGIASNNTCVPVFDYIGKFIHETRSLNNN